MLPLVARFPLFECPFELLEALFVVIETGLLFEIDAEQRRQQRILVVQQSARVGVLAGVLEQPAEARLVATPPSAIASHPRTRSSSRSR
ncbi:hypothetical protein SAMN04487946_107157 [Halobellus clavatus]|uniref:Uncharacterized protein n=1 Tax=Halobellus clavatus TaxID=660517 RepID=A0A1H3HLD0_9EURY|nr:hypothetical protein SAMN04487946_107157 [Halobellus clavatus]